VRPARLIVICAVLLAVPGCDTGDDDSGDRTAAERPPPTESQGTTSAKSLLIRDWLGALNNGDYAHAADFFAPGALVDQGVPYRLKDHAAARLWNSGLPCRADLVRIEPDGGRVLASFRLRDGPGGRCGGTVVVRFTFNGDRFSEFFQLQDGQPNPDSSPAEPA
jgi:hypothetical protein